MPLLPDGLVDPFFIFIKLLPHGQQHHNVWVEQLRLRWPKCDINIEATHAWEIQEQCLPNTGNKRHAAS